MNTAEPLYLKLFKQNKLKDIAEELKQHLISCDLCPNKCNVNRIKDKKGKCNTGINVKISSYSPHHGEEAPISGYKGSGTIFFAECNLKCEFCQNYDISQLGYGHEATIKELAQIMLKLQNLGCHNINFVSPTHVISQIVEALQIAVSNGLNKPLVYNTGGYDSVEIIKILNNIFDIYMPDMKYGDNDIALKYSKIIDYPKNNQEAVIEMHKQVGNLSINNGLAIKGLLIRHLILPGNLANTEIIVNFLASEVSKDTYINIMDQYYPAYNSLKYPELSRRITYDEFIKAMKIAQQAGLHRFDKINTKS